MYATDVNSDGNVTYTKVHATWLGYSGNINIITDNLRNFSVAIIN
jgi:hypothetical protein